MSVQFDNVRKLAVDIALEELGRNVREIGQENRGERIDLYERTAGVTLQADQPGMMWCGMFIYYCYKQAARRYGVTLPFSADRLWSGQKLVRWSNAHQDLIVNTCPIYPGDIYVLNSYHIGMAIESSYEGDSFRSIDGNQSTANSHRNSVTTNSHRLFSSCRLFVRI